MRFAPSTTLAGLVLLLAASAVSAWMTRALSPEPVPLDRFHESPAVREARQAGIPMVGAEEARRAMEEGSRLILDARPAEQYREDHIPTAMSLPVADFETAFPDIAPILEPDTPLLVYCTGPVCDEALRLALRLREAGFGNVSMFPGGMEAWKEMEDE